MNKKETILKAATHLFAQKGYRESSMAELAAMTGVAQGTIFYHYAAKEALFIAILQEFKEDVVQEFRDYLKEQMFRTGVEMMEGLVSFYLYLAAKMEDRFLLLHRHDAYELARTNAACREHLETIYYCFVGMFEQAMVAGRKDGSISDMDPKRTAMIIFTMVDGLVRFNTYSLYNASSLHGEVIGAVRRIIESKGRKTGRSKR